MAERSCLRQFYEIAGVTTFVLATSVALARTSKNGNPYFLVAGNQTSGGMSDIIVSETDSTNINLTRTDNIREDSPKWSPDGEYILYTAVNLNTGQSSIYRKHISGKVELINKKGFAQDPHWIMDGENEGKILFIGGLPTDQSLQLYIINADGTNQKKLTSFIPDFEPTGLNVSADGTKVVFQKYLVGISPTQAVITTMDINGNNMQEIIDIEGYQHSPQFSPDGKYLSFIVSNKKVGNKGTLYTLDHETGEIFDMENKTLPIKNSSWSPDSQNIVFSADPISAHTEIFIANPDLSKITQITNDRYFKMEPEWGMDGKIYFYTNRRGQASIYKMNPDGTQQEFVLDITQDRNIGFSTGNLSWYPQNK